MADCIALGKVLDGMKLGIRRYKDHKYLMLDKKIQKIKAHYSDMKLNEFIDEYLAGSYGLNSYELWVALSYKYDKYDVIDVFSPILAQVDIRNQKIEMDNIMANLLVPVISRIKELDRMDAKNDTTQSQNPPSPT
ncbi:MAG: hypothetical protein HY670_10430 [Chloroflexi bacterium]|nr:hypothetical protein [Chloroflexota bacterium]